MKTKVAIFSIFSLLTICCKSKQTMVENQKFRPITAISLDANQDSGTNSRIRSMMNTTTREKITIELDHKKYDETALKSILDTIKSEYRITIDKTKNSLIINRLQTK